MLKLVILHVENNELEQASVSDILTYAGYDVVWADTIPKAQKWLTKNTPNLIICDGTVGQTNDGLDYARALAREGRRVMVYSANNYSNVRDIPILVKPAGEREFLAKVVQLIG